MLLLLGAITPILRGAQALIVVVNGYREERTVLERTFTGSETAQAEVRTEALGGRRSPGVLGGSAEGLSGDPGTTMLRSQDGQHAQQPSQKRITEGQDRHEIWQAETREPANQAFHDLFLDKYGPKHEKPCECLNNDREVLPSFYDSPTEHWKHPRMTATTLTTRFGWISHFQLSTPAVVVRTQGAC
jgi:hypothetical protein